MGVAVGVLSAMAFGAGDFVAALATRRSATLPVVAGAQLTGLVALLGVLAIFRPDPPSMTAVITAAGAGLAGLVGLGALYRGMAIGPMGLVTALTGAGSLVPPLAVGAALGAAVGPLQMVGVACAAAAAALAGGPLGGALGRTALLLALVAAISLGGWYVLIDLAARQTDPVWVLVVSRATGGLVAAVIAEPSRRRIGRRLPILFIVGAGVFDVAGNALFVLTREQLPVGVAAALTGLYPIVTMLIARVILDERLTPAGWAGVGLAAAGIVLISIGPSP